MADNQTNSAPVAVEVTRGGVVESRHRASAAVVDAGGKIMRQWGDIGQAVFARSAIKSLQALPLIESGAAEAYDLGDGEIALACASHGAESFHTEAVAAWLARIGLTEADLECGAHLPIHQPTLESLLRGGGFPDQTHNNCSGKHLGFLTTARHLGEPTEGYIGADHPVQRRVIETLAEMSGYDLSRAAKGADGCGIPTLAIPLTGIATAMARFADPSALSPDRSAAVKRIAAAITARPEMVAGTGRFCTSLIRESHGSILAKTGAEGVYAVALPALGLGVAVKVDDGASRAAQVAVAAVLRAIGAIDEELEQTLADFLIAPIHNRADLRTGEVRPADGWAS
jgi:L-asparaginase II